jgi:hypothetical protein
MTDQLLLEDFDIPMLTFVEYRQMTEAFHNFLPSDTDKKTAHAKEVFDLLQKSYADQGGLKGNGFSSPEEMVKHVPMWKLAKKGGKVVSASMYKDTTGRKMVAIGTDGTETGKKSAGEMIHHDLKQNRSHMELSGKSLSFLKKITDIKPHLHSFDFAQKFHKSRGDEISKPADDDKEVLRHPELKDHFYTRMLGGHPHTKVMLGTQGKSITESITKTKEEEIENGKDSTLKHGIHDFGKWKMDTQIHGVSQAKERRPDMTADHWHDFLSRSHEALTNPSKHLTKPAKLTSMATLVYSKKHQQGVVLRVDPKDRNNLKLGGNTRIETILPHKQSIAKEGTQRIVIENVEYLCELIIID